MAYTYGLPRPPSLTMHDLSIVRGLGAALFLSLILPAQQDVVTQKRAMTLQDVMKFRQLRSPVISSTGDVVAFAVRPDRGDSEVHVHDLRSETTHRVPEATSPRIATGGGWAIATVVAPFDPTGEIKAKDKRKNGLAIVDVNGGSVEVIERVESSKLAKDGRHVAWKHYAPEKGDKDKEAKAEKSKRVTGTRLVLRRFGSGDEDTVIESVTQYAFTPDSQRLSYVVGTNDGRQNGLFHRDLTTGRTRADVFDGSVVHRFAWNEPSTHVAFTTSPQDDDGEFGDATLHVVDAAENSSRSVGANAFGDAWVLHRDTGLSWSKDGGELRFGVREKAMEDLLAALEDEKKKKSEEADKPEAGEGGDAAKEEAPAVDAFDLDRIRKDREVDVWHYRDPLISPNQKKSWGRNSKRSYRCVWDVTAERPVRLADLAMPDVTSVDGSKLALGSSDVPYRREITWDGRYRDRYLVDVSTGERRKVLERHGGPASLSPTGRYLVWYDDKHWFVRDDTDGSTRNLTAETGVRFDDEDHDYPRAVPGYGIAGWLDDGSAVWINDKYDVWRFDLDGRQATRVTKGFGRKTKRQFRFVDLDAEAPHIPASSKSHLFTSFDTVGKGWGMWAAHQGEVKLRRLVEAQDKFEIVAKAKDAERVLYTREDYDLFPDLHVANLDWSDGKQVTRFDSQREPFAWGTSELVEWKNEGGRTIQGAVIKPGDYDPSKRYPVLVYYYRFFSQRVHEWNDVLVNHRPCFPYWASNGYVVFLPDIRFDIGHPGHAATKCLVPGIAKLVELGIADEKRVALHGHSWSGYQTAHVITETNVFACAIAGAPVSNMTSAYGGVRWATGLSRQFQYEKTQSRIGGSLWDARDLYIENSPVFFADKIETPLLIQFGDEDGAVPWYQGIELYMAMRRLDKPCVFLQYRGEPHHLKKYANKVDYTVRFKEYVDHYCLGAPAPEWIETGEPYAGK